MYVIYYKKIPNYTYNPRLPRNYNYMAKSKNTDNITLRVGVYKTLLERHKAELKNHPGQTNTAFSGFVNDIIEHVLEKENFLRIVYPNLSTIGISEDVLYIKDGSTHNAKIGVCIRKGQLYCDYDDSNSCDHVNYALGIPEVAKLNLKHGLRDSKKEQKNRFLLS